jgi:hypothetical protein
VGPERCRPVYFRKEQFFCCEVTAARVQIGSTMSTPIIIVLVAVAAGLGVGVYLNLRRRGPVEEPVYYHLCERCKRKLRYRPRQAGHRGACPRCRHEFLFPPIRANAQ